MAKRTAAKKTAARKSAKPRSASRLKQTARPVRRRKSAARAAVSGSARRKPSPTPSRLGAAATAVKGTVAGVVAAVAGRLPWTSDQPDAIALLERDHRRLESLLARGEETTARAVKGRRQLLDTLTAELTAHELIEEKILYPALKAHPEARAIVLEGYQEHHVADLIVKELHQVAADHEVWGAKFKVLKESIEHHIQEEEGEMFRTARAVLPADDLRDMGARMAAMKQEALAGRVVA